MNDLKSSRRTWLAIAGFSIVYLILVFVAPNRYYQLVLTLVGVWAVMGISWNILSGYSGLVSFGHAAFFGLGAYTVILTLVNFNLTPWIGLPLAGVVGALAGLLVGLPTFRLRGHYFALAMLAYPLAFLYVFEWLGYQEVALPMKRQNPGFYMQFEDTRIYCIIVLVLLVGSILISRKIETSRFGMSLLAIKQNELAAEAAGIETRKWKLRAIAVSGAIAGVIGGFYAVILIVVTPPSVFSMLTSAEALIVVLFGGTGTVWGPVIGASVLIPLSETLQAELGNVLPGIQGVVFGVAIVLVILLAPEGLFWKVRDLIRKSRGRDKADTVLPNVDLVAAESNSAFQPAEMREAPKGNIILEVCNLSKSFGGLKAVQNVSFSVHEGSIVGIIGPNGAGKTTLFNLLNGFYMPSSGEVMYAGENIAAMQPSAICRRGIGRTFQVARPFTRLSILDNVLVGAYVGAETDKLALENARRALARVGLSENADRIADGLTGMEQRLMELARALAGQPRMLFLDEILAGLGSSEVNEMIGVIRRLAQSGITIIIVEHTMRAMLRLADHFIVLDHGAMLVEGKPQQVIREPAVIEAYLGKRWRERA
jgi:ABC-type branched-subunit amino acid transport system ATPase component/ABC-type branched-subunit amino acid transport system permease subunit